LSTILGQDAENYQIILGLHHIESSSFTWVRDANISGSVYTGTLLGQ